VGLLDRVFLAMRCGDRAGGHARGNAPEPAFV
jgi:hypothetical protein